MRYYINVDTKELLTETQARKQFTTMYDGFDSTNLVRFEEQYDEIVRVELDETENEETL